MKTDQNLGEDRLMLFPASETAPPLQIPGCALDSNNVATLIAELLLSQALPADQK